MKKELLQLIDSSDIVSFDIFDTLIFRNIFEPTDIFKILSNYAKNKYNIIDFFDVRIKSESESRIKENNFESNYNEIYHVILKKLKNKNIVQDLKKKELELELEFCVANPFMKEIFEYCYTNGKKIVLISDMYLERKFIEKILSNNGYKKVDVYVSGEVRKNKGSKELFQYVYEKNHFDKDNWLHIGDNTHSDYNMPIDFGINAFNYPKVSKFTEVKPKTIMESICLAIQTNYLYNGNDLDYWEFFGIKYVSFIYFGFTKWLYDLTKDQDNLYFLARDGYIPYQIYEKFNKDKKVYTKYLYCSRKTIQIPALILDDKDNLVDRLTNEILEYNEMTLKEYLKNSQVDFSKMEEGLVKVFEFKDLNDIVNSKNRRQAKKLVARLYDNIKENLLKDYDLALNYLKQEGMEAFNKINVMDIGWGGSIQEAIGKLLNKDVVGYYFGTIDLKKENSFSNMFGYYFDLDQPILNKEKIFSNVMMYELIFSAPHGTNMSYEYKDNKYVPILSNNVKYNRIVETFQKSALNIIDKYCCYLDYFDSLDKEFCLIDYQKFLEKPKYKDLEEFSKLSNDFILGSDRLFSYVNRFSLNDIKHNSKNFYDKIKQSLWRDKFFIEDSKNFDKDYFFASCICSKVRYLQESLIPLKCAKIYFDYGDGFSEENVMFVPYNQEGPFLKFKIKIDAEVRSIRIDPIEGKKIKINNLSIHTNKGNASVFIPHKDYFRGKLSKCIFINSYDPRIVIKNTDEVNFVSFSAIIKLV